MKLVSYPTSFSSIFDDNYFRFEEVDPSTPTEILTYLKGGRLLGARRYAGRTVIETTPKALLRRVIAPKPRVATACQFMRVADRDVAIRLAYDDNTLLTPTVRFTASHKPLYPLSAFGPREQWRTLSQGEFDELSFIAPEGARLEAYCRCGGGEWIELASLQDSGEEDIFLLTVEADHLFSVVGGERDVELMVYVAGNEVVRVHYSVDAPRKDDVRLAWLNEYGSISYHTFHRNASEQIHSSRNESQTAHGTEILSLQGWRSLSLESGFLSSGEMESVAGVVTSPMVWIVEGGNFAPVTLTSSKALCDGVEGYSVTLTLRPIKKQTYW